MAQTDPGSVDLTNCETEPIRFPGTIQPHGALLVVQVHTGLVLAASESCEELLGRPAASFAERTLGELLGTEAQVALMSALQDGARNRIPLSVKGIPLLAKTIPNGTGQLLVEFERDEPAYADFQTLLYRCRLDIAELRRLDDLDAVVGRAAQVVRSLTEFDRVMIYRFDEHWNGEVIAEACAPGIESYLGLHYPAGDIPRQARELFRTGGIRHLPDVHYEPSALVSTADGRSFDLGAVSLRSVSPVHLEYLRNMGVRATLVGSLVVRDRLWGLVSCQHVRGPKRFGPRERDALEWLCEDLAALIGATIVGRRGEREYALWVRRKNLVDAIRRGSVKDLVRQANPADLLEVAGADGFALVTDGAIQTVGVTPSNERIRELDRRRGAQAGRHSPCFTKNLVHDLGVADWGDGISGVLFVTARQDPALTLAWFRRERNQTIRWGGDPGRAHVADENGRISPRTSFALFLEEIRGQCLAWSPEEVNSAAELGALVESECVHEREALARSLLPSPS
ncbi:MAG: GAF domain-containing protein [Betaproteobacteria bacterium]|nr:GAF domain-containing protein [Betaproteobacteria bacterium]